MSDAFLKATYSTQDVAFALQHGNFANFQRELTRTDASVLPRKRARGPGGGEYRYAHVLELAFQLAIGGHRNRSVAKSAFWGFLRELQARGTKKLNDLPDEDRNAILFGGSGFEDEDFPASSPHDLAQLVDFPTIYFGSDFLSRDPGKPAFLLFDNNPPPGARGEVSLVGDISLSEVHKALIKLKLPTTHDDRWEEIIREQFDELPVLNLTALLERIDSRLKLRLKARDIRGA